MQFEQRDSGLIVPVKPEPPKEPEPPRGEYGEPWRRGMSTTDFGESNVHIDFDRSGTGVECHFPLAGIGDNPSGGDLADRIVLCVNACRDLSDEALSRVVSGEFPLIVDYSRDEDEDAPETDSIDLIKAMVRRLPKEQRQEIVSGFGEFCHFCGEGNLPCYCECNE